MAEPAEAGDDLVEDQQDAVLGRDLAQLLQITLGRRQDAGRARHRLDDDGGDGGGIVQVDEPGQFVGQMRAPLRLALGEGLLGAVVGRLQVVDALQHVAELLAVGDHAADRDAAEADAVIAALAADEARARALAAGLVIGERDLERGVDGLAARVGEEGIVEIARRQQRQPRCQLEHLGVAVLEGRRVVELGRHLLDGLDDRLAAVAGVDAEEARGGVDHLGAVGLEVVHALGAGEQARPLLEGAVGRERHPVGLEFVGLHVERGHDTRLLRKSAYGHPCRNADQLDLVLACRELRALPRSRKVSLSAVRAVAFILATLIAIGAGNDDVHAIADDFQSRRSTLRVQAVDERGDILGGGLSVRNAHADIASALEHRYRDPGVTGFDYALHDRLDLA